MLCSNTLLELPSAEQRLTSLNNLWERVEEGGYLVLVETGTNAGFHVIVEARDYLTQVCFNLKSFRKENSNTFILAE